MIDIKKCLQELTTEEKISLLEGADMGFTTAVERLGIPRILMVDGPHGVRVVRGTDTAGKEPYTMTGPMNEATALPCEAAMAAAWNTELVELAGKQVGEECQSYGVGVLLGPGRTAKDLRWAGAILNITRKILMYPEKWRRHSSGDYSLRASAPA